MVEMHPNADKNLNGQPRIAEDGRIIIAGYSGKGVYGYSDENICGGRPGYIYPFPVRVLWEGTVEIEEDEFLGLEIDPPHRTMYVGETQAFTVTAVWKQNGQIKKYPVTHDRLAWSSSQPDRASVNASGVVTGMQETQTDAVITATFVERDASVSATVKVLKKETPAYAITGDFDILPSNTINYRDSFTLRPKNFVIPNACTYLYHEYRIEKDGIYWTSPRVGSQSADSGYSYSTYPPNIGVGSNFIQIRITAVCGENNQIVDSGWTAGKYLHILSPAGNRPPEFSAGFFKEYNRTGWVPDTEVVAGTRVNLRIIHDPTKEPPWPYDPDGDPITYTWLFESSSSAWIRSLPQEYGLWRNDEAHYNLIASEIGHHSVTVIARDPFGGESRRTAYINVVPPNPIPIIDGPAEVKENRPLPKPFDGSRSYSPAGYRIVEYIWDNKKNVYTKPGIEKITLDVVDSQGLRSLTPAVHTLTVLPDDPPVAVLEAEPLGIRGKTYSLYNKSYSPDGDKIVSAAYRYRYDADNNGFEDDEWVALPGDLTKALLTPQKVGKYEIGLTVTEDYGKSATTTRVVDVVNLAPSVSFEVEGRNDIPEPPPIQTGIPADVILANWTLFETNSTVRLQNRPHMWSSESGKLLAGLGKGMERQYAFNKSMYFGNNYTESYRLFPLLSDNGYGPNSLSPYRALVSRDASRSGPILLPGTGSSSRPFTTGEDYAKLTPAKFASLVRTNEQYIYFDQKVSEYDYSSGSYRDVTYIFALNKNRIPRVQSKVEATGDGSWYNVRLVYEWLDPNPYDFIIKIPRYAEYTVPCYTDADQRRDPGWRTKADAGDFSGASSTYSGAETMSLAGVEISGSRIYAVYEGYRGTYAYYDRDSDGKTRHVVGGMRKDYSGTNYFFVEVRIYDAFTGEYLGSSFDVNADSKKGPRDWFSSPDIIVAGENLIVRNRTAENRYIEFDRNGKIVASGTVPLQPVVLDYGITYRNALGRIITPDPSRYVCHFGDASPALRWKDDEGNDYTIRQLACYQNGDTKNPAGWYDVELNPDFPQGPHLVKINRDHTLGLVAKLPGNELYRPQTGMYDMNIESNPLLAINPAANKAYVRTFTRNACSGCMYPSVTENHSTVDLETGEVSGFGYRLLIKTENSSQGFYITHSGQIGQGWRTHSASGELHKLNHHASRQMEMDATSLTFNEYGTTSLRFGEYVGDGMWLSIYGGYYQGSGPGFSQGYTTTDAWMLLDVGTASSNQAVKSFRFGQFVSPDTFDNAEFAFNLSMDRPAADPKLAGLSFRMADPKNRYAVETDGSELFLSRYVSGSRAILARQAVPFQPKVEYSFRIVAEGDRIQVFMNGVPYFDVTDGQFASGSFGPFSDKSFVVFSGIAAKAIQLSDDNWLSNYAIWEEGSAKADVRYKNIVFEDPENDPPAGSYRWNIQHTPKFLNNQGLSALHGKTFTDAVAEFDKVGVYRVSLRAQDDPQPDYRFPSDVFAEYRKDSNEYWQFVTVHRRPVARFTLSVDPSTHHVVWNDTSHDPDRWASPANYSTEETGIDYAATRGILERRYFYITPSGEWVDQKLVTPAETGTYQVGLQVKDEYGAWSYWTVQSIEITEPAEPNLPPVAGFTVTPSAGHRGTAFTITSTAHDPEDGPAANLQHAYYIRNVTEGTPETLQSTSRGTWTKTFSSLGVFEIRQVVTDSKGLTDQFLTRVAVSNRAPAADFRWSPVPAWEGDTVRFQNLSADPDGDALTHEWHIRTEDGALLHATTDVHPAFRFGEPGRYLVTLRVSDGRDDAQTTRTVSVLPLFLEADIGHVPEWLAHHQELGHRTEEAPKQFYSGERILLYARHADAAYDRITAKLETTGADGRPLAVEAALVPSSETPGLAVGELYDERFSSLDRGLPRGIHHVVFFIRYANGVEKTAVVPFEIIGHVLGTVQVHRVR